MVSNVWGEFTTQSKVLADLFRKAGTSSRHRRTEFALKRERVPRIGDRVGGGFGLEFLDVDGLVLQATKQRALFVDGLLSKVRLLIPGHAGLTGVVQRRAGAQNGTRSCDAGSGSGSTGKGAGSEGSSKGYEAHYAISLSF